MNAGAWANEISASATRVGARPAVVLSGSYSGLALIRSLGRRGIPVFVLDSGADEPGMHSRYARPQILPEISRNGEAWIDFLLAAGRGLECRPVLFPAGDPHLR